MAKRLVLKEMFDVFPRNVSKKVVTATKAKSVAQGENSGITIGEKLAVMVPAPLIVMVVDAEDGFNMEIVEEGETLQD